MGSPEQSLCEAVAADINAKAGLDDHLTILFTRPRIILPDNCPLLCVWIQAEDEAAIETERVSYWGVLGISWHRESIENVTDLVDDPDLQIQLFSEMKAIKDRTHYMTYHGFTPDIPEIEEFVPSGWRLFDSEYDEGLTFGYAGACRFRMVDTPPPE